MKKLLVMAAILVAGVVANAASFSWSAAHIYGPDGNLLSSATVSLYCDALGSDALSTVSVANGAIAATTFDATAGTNYDFYFKIKTTSDSKEVTFTSANVSAAALDVGTQSLGFGNQKSATQASGAWATAGADERAYAPSWHGGSSPQAQTRLIERSCKT